MACPAVTTGEGFLLKVIANIDCQAQIIGSYGFQSLSSPSGLAATLLPSLLILFVAIFGYRMLLGPAPGMRDVTGDILKVGFVITLVLSWPAARTIIHGVVLDGPSQIVSSVMGERAPPTTMAARLQEVDNGIVALTTTGTGRTIGALLDNDAQLGGFRGIAASDDAAFGWARFFWLGGVMAPLILLRIAAGLLLALTPLAALMLLFEPTRGLFAGWAKGLMMTFLGSVAATALFAVELAVLEPWIADALRTRQLGYAIPSAPSELMALTAAGAFASFALIALMAKVAFQRGWPSLPVIVQNTQFDAHELGWKPAVAAQSVSGAGANPSSSRARDTAEHIRHLQQLEASGDWRSRASSVGEQTTRQRRVPDNASPRASASDRLPAPQRRSEVSRASKARDTL